MFAGVSLWIDLEFDAIIEIFVGWLCFCEEVGLEMIF